MAQVEVCLLGKPVVRVDGEAVAPPKGAKAWGLLAYLVCTGRPHARTELAELLFADAVDPLGALRWNLAALRRTLGASDALKGDPVAFDVPDAVVDVEAGRLGSTAHRGQVPTGGHVLLAGLSFPDCPAFELWLAGERARAARWIASSLRERTLRALAAGDHADAVDQARRLVVLDALDEGHHALVIRAYALGGDRSAARAHYEECRGLLRRELGTEPGSAVLAAVRLAEGMTDIPDAGDLDVLGARMTVAWQSFLAGSVDHGIDLGRSVVSLADATGDGLLRIMARLFLAAKLSIAVRGWDEGATVAAEALILAEQRDRADEEATARGILAGIELMRADYRSAAHHAEVGAARSADPSALALNLAFLAAVEADTGRSAEAVEHAREAVRAGEESGDPLRIGYATAYTGHALLLAGDVDGARPYVARAVEVLAPMSVLVPWPLAMQAEIEARSGALDVAAATAARAGAMAATTGIPYQRALALRASALVDAARGDAAQALDRLTAALGLARRTTGEGYAFHWPIAWILESLAVTAADVDPEAATRWTDALLDHATAVDMDTFVDRGRALAAEAG